LVRDLGRVPALPGVEVARAHYHDTDAVAAALQGVATVFMVSAAESIDRVDHHRSFVDGAVRAGVQHLVYTTFVGAGPTATFTLVRHHGATEDYVRASGLDFTFLRNNLYADFFPLMVGSDDVLRGPAGTGHVAAVAQDDIADVAAAVLRDPAAHRGRTYDLTGPEALDLGEVSEILSTALNRPIAYKNETVAEAYASRACYDAPRWQVDAWVTTYTAIAAGELAAVTDDVERISGHPATSVAELLRPSGSSPLG
jgi:uncharacterized protein YbjT (DUF2867 family)